MINISLKYNFFKTNYYFNIIWLNIVKQIIDPLSNLQVRTNNFGFTRYFNF